MKMRVLLVSLLFLASHGYARITGTQPTNADVWCVGPLNAEMCIDASGNLVPTVTNNQTMGTSGLKFSNIFAAAVNFTASTIDALTVTGTSLFSGAANFVVSLTAQSSATIQGAALVNGTLTAGGATNLVGASTSQSSHTIIGAGLINGSFTSGGASNFVGASTSQSSHTIVGAAKIAGILTLTGSNIIGPQTYASAATISSGTLNNMWNVVGSTKAFIGTGNVSFTGLQTNRRYRLNVMATISGNGIPSLQFNNDSGASVYRYNFGGGMNLSTATAADSMVSFSTHTTGDGGLLNAVIQFSPNPDNTTQASGIGTVGYIPNAGAHVGVSGAFQYGSATITSVQFILRGGGSFNPGHFYLEELIVPNP